MRRFLLVFALAVGVLALLAAPALASPKTFYVHPSGGNDTANIQAAFNAAVKAGPGSTVQLSAGTFYTNNIVVQNFDGYFRGAGQAKTFIDCLRGLDPSLPGATEAGNPGYWLSLFLFEGGTIGVSDMSFDITAASPAEQWNNAGSPADYLGAMVQVCGNASSSFNRVGFSAGAGNDSGYNADEGLLISGVGPLDANDDPTIFESTTGIDSVCGCSFAGHDGMQVNGLTAGKLTVNGNTFDEWSDVAWSTTPLSAPRWISPTTRCRAPKARTSGSTRAGWPAAGPAPPCHRDPRPTSSSPTTTSSPAVMRAASP